MIRRFSLLFIFFIVLSGCAGQASRWREDAYNRFNTVLSAGSKQFAPEETENISQTLLVADRYFNMDLRNDAEGLYRLSCQKSQLLYRNLILSKVRQGSNLTVTNEATKQPQEIIIATEPVRISEILQQSAQEPISCGSDAEIGVCTDTSDGITPHNEPIPVPLSPLLMPDTGQQKALPENDSAPTSPHPPKVAPNVHASSKPAKKIFKNNHIAKRNNPAGYKTIYLTFDDGPSRLTLPIASYLNSQGIAATFFALGRNIKGHEKVVRETVALGHLVGNHTMSHDLHKLKGSLSASSNEIGKTAALVEKLGGDGKMVRIPYGATSKTLISTVAAEGGQIFDWDINSLDSSRTGAKDHAYIEQAVIQQLHKSGKRHIIMLFHDGAGHEATLVAIRNLVPRLKQDGYRFGLLSRSDRVAQSKAERNPTP